MGPAGETGTSAARLGGRASRVALTAGGWAVGLLVTAVILGTPYLLFGYHSPTLQLVLGTIDGCVALLVSYLVFGRFVRSRLVQDLLLAQGLLLLAVAGPGLVVLLHLTPQQRPETLEVWLPVAIRTVGAVLVALASLAGTRTAGAGARRWGGWLPWAALVGGTLLLWALRDQLPVALAASPPPTAARPVVTGHPALLLAQGLGALCFGLASVAFTVRGAGRRDHLLTWLGPACALAAFARVNYVLFPSLYSDWLYTGDLLRTGGYVLLLVGAAREIEEYWSTQARAAVLEDRRRLARELHDGVVQEIAYIRAEVSSRRDEPLSGSVVAACDRALDEARSAVDALGRPEDEPLGVVLQRAARQVADRYGATLEADIDDAVAVDQEQQHTLVRIVREAVSNAIRHGGARKVRLRLVHEPGADRLVVEDDGVGFDVGEPPASGGYGLVSMRERAASLPGALEIRSSASTGTTVGVSW